MNHSMIVFGRGVRRTLGIAALATAAAFAPATWAQKSFPTPEAAVDAFDTPSQNIVYADVDGNIGYALSGRLPVRSSGDGTLPSSGGFVPADRDRRFEWLSGFYRHCAGSRSKSPPH